MLVCHSAPAAPQWWEQKHLCGSGKIKFPMDLGTSCLTCRSLRAPGVWPGVPRVPVGMGCGRGAGLGAEPWEWSPDSQLGSCPQQNITWQIRGRDVRVCCS